MATHCQTAARSRGVERQNIGAVNPFEGKTGGGGQLQTESLIRVVTLVFTLFCDTHGIHCMESLAK